MYQILNSYDTGNLLFPPQSADAKSFDSELFTLKSSFSATFWPALRQMFSWERRIPGAQWEIRSWCGLFSLSCLMPAATGKWISTCTRAQPGDAFERLKFGSLNVFFSKCIVTGRETEKLRSSFSSLCSASGGMGQHRRPRHQIHWFFVSSAAAAIEMLRVRWDVQEESAFQMHNFSHLLSTWFQVIDLKPLHLSALQFCSK